MAKRIDKRKCRRVQSALIGMTHPDGWLAEEYPYAVETMRNAVLCIKWLLERDEKREAKQ